MPYFEEKRFLNFSAEQLYKLVLDVNNYPKFVPWCSKCKIISSEPNKIVADMDIKFGIFEDSYRSLITHKQTENGFTIEIEQLSGPFLTLDTKWSFVEKDNMSSILEFKIDFEFESNIANKIITPIFSQTTKTMIKAFEERARRIYGNN